VVVLVISSSWDCASHWKAANREEGLIAEQMYGGSTAPDFHRLLLRVGGQSPQMSFISAFPSRLAVVNSDRVDQSEGTANCWFANDATPFLFRTPHHNGVTTHNNSV
jgi:hypothetical protein